MASWSGCSRSSQVKRALARADGYFQKGDFDRAEIEYKNVLQKDRQNALAIRRLGEIAFDRGSMDRAILFLGTSERLEPGTGEGHLALARLYLKTGSSDKARDEARAALGLEPSSAEAPVLLAEAASSAADRAQAAADIGKLSTDKAASLLALGILERRKGAAGAAAAEADFRKAIEAEPGLAQAHLQLGLLLLEKRDAAGGRKEIETAASLSPERSPIRLGYAEFLAQQGDEAGAEAQLAQMRTKAPDYIPAWILSGEIALSRGRIADAKNFSAKANAKDAASPEALLLSAQCLLAGGDAKGALAVLDRMALMYPKAPEVHYQLARGRIAAGDQAGAAAALTDALALRQDFPKAQLLLAEVRLRRGEFAPVISSMEAFARQHADSLDARLILAEAQIRSGSVDDALATYRETEKLFPKSARAAILDGAALAQAGRPNEARERFEAAEKIAPGSLAASEQITYLDIVAKDYKAAEARVDADARAHPKSAVPLILRGRILRLEGKPAEAEAALRAAIKVEPDSPIAYQMLASLEIEQNRRDDALRELREATAKNPGDAAALMIIGIIDEQKSDYAGARDAYEKILESNPNFGSALNNLAYLYSEQFHDLDKAFAYAQKASVQLPDDGRAADTLGWILYKRKQYVWALSVLKEAAQRLPNDAEAQFHLGMALYACGNEEAARTALGAALRSDPKIAGAERARTALSVLDVNVPALGTAGIQDAERRLKPMSDDPEAQSRLAAAYARDGNTELEVGADKAALAANPSFLPALKDLAGAYLARGQFKDAMGPAASAHKLAPDDPAVTRQLGAAAFGSGDYKFAASLLEDWARSSGGGDPPGLLALGRARYAIGNLDGSLEAVRQAEPGLTGLSREKARQFLVLAPLFENPAAAGDHRAEAEAALKADASDVPALMAVGRSDEASGSLAEAADLYRRALKAYPSFTPASLRLAVVLSRDPANDEATAAQAAKAQAAFPDNPELAQAMGLVAYRQGDFRRSADLLSLGAKSGQADPETFYYLGMSELKLHDTARSHEALARALSLHLKPALAEEAKRALASK
jgi:tetratricopeptide (TPR) repeat protein